MLRRVFEIYREGLDFRSARRALNEFVRRSRSAGEVVPAKGLLGRMTVQVSESA